MNVCGQIQVTQYIAFMSAQEQTIFSTCTGMNLRTNMPINKISCLSMNEMGRRIGNTYTDSLYNYHVSPFVVLVFSVRSINVGTLYLAPFCEFWGFPKAKAFQVSMPNAVHFAGPLSGQSFSQVQYRHRPQQ